MSKITSPPEVVKQAEYMAGVAAFAVIVDKKAQGVDGREAAAGLRSELPHLDNASLVVIASYVARTAAALAHRVDDGRMTARRALTGLCYAATAMTVEFGNDLVDDLDEANRTATEDALSALRQKLAGENPKQDAGADEALLDRGRDLLARTQPEADAA